jgi:hypothetical protein
MSKMTLNNINKETDDAEVNAVQHLFKNMSLNAKDEDVSNLIDQMSCLTIKDNEMEITMNDKTVIKIFIPCHVQNRIPMEVMRVVNCF